MIIRNHIQLPVTHPFRNKKISFEEQQNIQLKAVTMQQS